MKVIEKMVNRMAMESTLIQMAEHTKVNGNSISNMELVKKFELMGPDILGDTRGAKNLEKACILGRMVHGMKVIGAMTSLMDRECGKRLGLYMLESLKMDKCMVKVFIHGMTEECTMASTSMTRNTGTEYINGPINEHMKDNGVKENKTGLVSSPH